MKRLYTLFLGTGLLLSGCMGQSNEFTVVDDHDVEEKEFKPSLKVNLEVEGNKAIVYVDTDLVVSKANYGLESVKGEGHIHLFLDNGEKQGITVSPHIIEDIESGNHELRISLHNNDHTPYGVSEVIEFEIK
ncbi:hypothetical protein [Bacillus pinisoli]|uniref:hypothetical protein n=1 Tax=Bacillus pinisoli TaxID=2901866 RepID=UPI001FF6D560|nr:hypothetical protein [Bacillus pinisoli]